MPDDTKGPSAEALRFIYEISLCPHADEILAWAFAFDAFAAQAVATMPIDVVLFCPACGVQHIDQPQREKGWSNPAHKTHECQGCGHLWRPSSTPTNGVADVALGTSDTRPAVRGVAAARERPLSADLRALLQRCADALCRYATDYPAQPDLCLHPIAYYAGSWGGGMCPTDDVIAHLMLMRGDEPMFWRRANQHPPYRSEAGL